MPRRRNNHESLAVRLARITPSGPREPHQIPGSRAWSAHRTANHQQVPYESNYREGMSAEEIRAFEKIMDSYRCFPDMALLKQQGVINEIIDRTDHNGWQLIEGGELDSKWVNAAYQDKVFNSGKIIDQINGDEILFPISSGEDDPQGLAFHFEAPCGGAQSRIVSNEWHYVEDNRYYRRRRRWEQRRKDRLVFEEEAAELAALDQHNRDLAEDQQNW